MPRQRGDDVENLVVALVPGSDSYHSAVVGLNVRRVRRERGWNQTELAAALTARGWKCAPKMISAMEINGTYGGRRHIHVPVTVDRLILLAEVLQVHWLWLMDDSWALKTRERLAPQVAWEETQGGE
jgi:transcriptional regulator with XRE-family HTH domain